MKLYSTRKQEKSRVKKIINYIFNLLGYKIVKNIPENLQNYSADFLELISKKDYTDYTMQSIDNLYSLFQSIKYVSKNNIPGDIVECGVWRGGAMMLAIDTLKLFSDNERHVWLYDTFSGMTKPTKVDVNSNGNSADETMKKIDITDDYVDWSYADITDVKNNISLSDYPEDKIHFIKGDILQTVPDTCPNEIAILRLDTDWYESTAHEMKYLYPKLVKKGILIVDDYGTWEGSKKAVDEYFKGDNKFFNRVDKTAVLLIK